MFTSVFRVGLLFSILLLALVACNAGSRPAAVVPVAAVDSPLANAAGQQTAVVAGGCFWGVQAVFQHVKGGFAELRTISPHHSSKREFSIRQDDALGEGGTRHAVPAEGGSAHPITSLTGVQRTPYRIPV